MLPEKPALSTAVVGVTRKFEVALFMGFQLVQRGAGLFLLGACHASTLLWQNRLLALDGVFCISGPCFLLACLWGLLITSRKMGGLRGENCLLQALGHLSFAWLLCHLLPHLWPAKRAAAENLFSPDRGSLFPQGPFIFRVSFSVASQHLHTQMTLKNAMTVWFGVFWFF